MYHVQVVIRDIYTFKGSINADSCQNAYFSYRKFVTLCHVPRKSQGKKHPDPGYGTGAPETYGSTNRLSEGCALEDVDMVLKRILIAILFSTSFRVTVLLELDPLSTGSNKYDSPSLHPAGSNTTSSRPPSFHLSGTVLSTLCELAHTRYFKEAGPL